MTLLPNRVAAKAAVRRVLSAQVRPNWTSVDEDTIVREIIIAIENTLDDVPPDFAEGFPGITRDLRNARESAALWQRRAISHAETVVWIVDNHPVMCAPEDVDDAWRTLALGGEETKISDVRREIMALRAGGRPAIRDAFAAAARGDAAAAILALRQAIIELCEVVDPGERYS